MPWFTLAGETDSSHAGDDSRNDGALSNGPRHKRRLRQSCTVLHLME